MLEYYSNKASTMILFRIQRHSSKPKTVRDGLVFILHCSRENAFFPPTSLPEIQSWNSDSKESDTF